MTDTPRTSDLPLSHPLHVASLHNRKPTQFNLVPNTATRAAMAKVLEITDLPDFRFKGELRPTGRTNFTLEAEMKATVEQPCSITLAPIVTRLTESVKRYYDANFTYPEDEETEMPEDDTTEPLLEVIDIGSVAMEALVLSLPLYPRSAGVKLGETVFAAPGEAPLREKDLRPFAGLAVLRDCLECGEKDK